MIPQWLQDIDTAFSLMGFFLTFVVFRAVSEVKASFQRKARLPEILKDLTKCGSELSKSLSSSPVDEITANMEIKSATSVLRLAKKYLPSEEKREIKFIIKRLEKISKDKSSKSAIHEELWDSYTEIQVAIRVINQAHKSTKWE